MFLIRVSFGGSLFFVPIGRGVTQGYIVECEACRTRAWTDATRYPNVANSSEAAVSELILQTNPTLEPGTEEAKAENWVHAGWTTLFRQPNQVLFERYSTGDSWDWRAILAVLGVVASVFLGRDIGALLGWAFHLPPNDTSEWKAIMVFGLFVPAFLWMLREVKYERKRFFRKRLLPALIKGLSAHSLKHGELVEFFRRLAKYRYPLARVTTAGQVWEAMNAEIRRA